MCVAAAIAGAAVVGAAATAYSANKSAGAQEDAANKAQNTQLSMFNRIQQNEAPWVGTGAQANSALAQFYGLPGANGAAANAPNYSKILSNLPGYQFQLQQGTLAAQRNLAANGLLDSGAAQKSLTQYGQGLAQSYAGQYTQGLTNLSQMGQAGAAGVATAGMNAANQSSAAQIYGGNAAAAGYANSANAINGGLAGLANAAGYSGGFGNSGYVPNSYNQSQDIYGGANTTPSGYINQGGYLVNTPP